MTEPSTATPTPDGAPGLLDAAGEPARVGSAATPARPAAPTAPSTDPPTTDPPRTDPPRRPPAGEPARGSGNGLPVRLTTGPEQPRVRMRQRIARLGTTRPQTPVLDPLFKVIRANHPKAELAPIEQAYRTAERYHRGQTRKSGDAYITHPLAVTTILAELGMTESTLCARCCTTPSRTPRTR